MIFQAASHFSFKIYITFHCHDTKFLWNFLAELLCFRQKESIKVQILRLFCALMRAHPIPHASFETNVKVYSNFSLLFSVMKDNSSIFFQLKLFFFGQNAIFILLNEWVNIHQIPYVIFETILQFFFKLYITLQYPEDNSSVLFWLNLYVIWAKADHQSAKFQNFNCSCKILPNLYFDRLLLLQVYKISAKNAQRSYVFWPWKNDMRNLANFHQSTEECQNWDFDGILLSKVENVWA